MQPFVKRTAAEKRHDEVRAAIDYPGVIDSHDMGVAGERAEGADFLLEARDARSAGAVVEDLDGDRALEGGLPAPVNGCETASTDGLEIFDTGQVRDDRAGKGLRHTSRVPTVDRQEPPLTPVQRAR